MSATSPIGLALPLTLTIALGAAVALDARQGAPPPQPAESRPSFEASATAVVVDVVVRDKGGKPVTDLTAADFELYENDVRQDIGTLTLVTPQLIESASNPPPGGAAPPPAAGAERPVAVGPAFVALVFDRLSPEARALAHKGALAYLDTVRPNDFGGVFLIDQSLSTVQTYTNNKEKLRAGIEAAATRPPSSFARGQGRMTSNARGSLNPATPVTSGAEDQGPGTPLSPSPGDPADPAFAGGQQVAAAERVALRMERSYDSMMRDQQGLATTAGLLALVDSLGTLPGRKTVVLFAEGVAIPPAVQAQFDSVIATANRANVSVYTIDAAGLRVHSAARSTALQVGALGQAGTGDVQRSDDQAYMRDLELNEDILREDPSVGLTILAERTGGFMINNTNDLERGFRQIDADRRFHYLLTYTPKNTDFNGEYRPIRVRVPSRSVTIRARSGYVAVRPGGGPILTHEGPALAMLDRTPMPAQIPIRGAAFSFPDPKGPGQLALIVSAEPAALTFQTDGKTKTFHTEFTILARVRAASGDVVLKASQPYRLEGPADQVEAAKKGEILFFRQPALAPGAYSLDYVVHDRLGDKAGAGSVPFTVHDKPGQPLQVSSLILVQRTERVPEAERSSDNPLFHEDLLLYPNLGTPLRKGIDKTLSFAITAYGAAGGAPPTATLELAQGGAPLGQVALPVPAPDAEGRARIASQLPLDSFPPGEYSLKVTVSQGTVKEERTATFSVAQ